MSHPRIIQGGLGVAVSGWTLARAVSKLGQLGVVSGTALAVVLARRLQMGDPGGHMRRALARFPFPDMAARILREFFIEGGKAPEASFKPIAMPTLRPRRSLTELTVAANFVEVFLAKEGQPGPVGINFLEKIQLPTLPSLYGAMLAGVDYVLMGAGIPRAIPGIMDRFAAGEPARMRLDVAGALPGESYESAFDPSAFAGGPAARLPRPRFIGIVASAILAITLARKSSGQVDGFVVEGPVAGGHNAPPRGALTLNDAGEPVYGARDAVQLDKIAGLGLPFWLAGSYGRPGGLAAALALGATGIQVGTAFAFCEESGMDPEIRRRGLARSREGTARVRTDPRASPTGFPFKVAALESSLSEPDCYQQRTRVCDLGYLRQLYRKHDGSVGYRCPSEPVATFVRRGGEVAETQGRKCICNGLASTVCLGQTRAGGVREPPILTAGDDLKRVAAFLAPGRHTYTAADVITRITEGTP